MSKIMVLDKNTINQIAAGEVVERPASVVKELVENAIDADSTAITVEIKEGGIQLIRVSDNGSGIDAGDIKTAFLRHSTSKLKTVEDLLTIGSLGFRGEALSSIASIAQVELVTKTRSSFTGSRYVIEGGEEKELSEIGCPEGTTFIIKDLFYNTPARRKFLKSAQTESGYITDLMERLAISHPNISFKYMNNNKTILHTSGNGYMKDIIYHVYGRDITSNVLEVNEEIHAIKITGLIGKPVVSRGNRNYENYFINGRYIKSSIITKAIEEAYKPYSMQHKYPFTVLNLEIDSTLIDVNVHPTKMELRFVNGEEVYRAVYNAVKNTLSGKNMIPDVVLVKEKETSMSYGEIPEPFETMRLKKTMAQNEVKEQQKAEREREIESMNQSLFMEEPIGLKEIPYQRKEEKPKQQNLFDMDTVYDSLLSESTIKQKEVVNSLRVIGQLFSTYWLVEYNMQLYIIDQHAAHEKILYEELINCFHKKDFSSQIVSPPIILTLSQRESEVLKEHNTFLESIGFTIEHFGGKEYSVSSVPADMYNIDGKELIVAFLDDLSDDSVVKTPEIILEKVAMMSCKAAIKANHTMSETEALEMIEKLMTLENPFHCPHGRPVIIAMTKNEIEKKFKRIV